MFAAADLLGADHIIKPFKLFTERIKIAGAACVFNMNQQVEIAIHALRTMYITVVISTALDRAERPNQSCLLYTSPSPRDATLSRMPSSA